MVSCCMKSTSHLYPVYQQCSSKVIRVQFVNAGFFVRKLIDHRYHQSSAGLVQLQGTFSFGMQTRPSPTGRLPPQIVSAASPLYDILSSLCSGHHHYDLSVPRPWSAFLHFSQSPVAADSHYLQMRSIHTVRQGLHHRSCVLRFGADV